MLEFYRDFLGGELIRASHIPSSDTKLAYVQIGERVVEFLCPPQADPSRLGLEHIAFSVDDLDRSYENMKAAGVVFSVAPKTAGSGVGRVAFLSDPDGIRVELLAQPRFNRPVSTLKMNGHLADTDHVSLRVADAARSRAFYERHFGAKRMTFDYMACGANVLELVQVNGGEPPAGSRLQHLALRVDDVDRTVADFAGAGIRIDGEPRDAATRIGRVAVILDRIEVLDRADLRKL